MTLPERSRTVDAVLDGGSAVNEDRWTVVDGAAWVLDGTSGFTDRTLTSHSESDGVWFVETVDSYLRDHVHEDRRLAAVVAGAIEHTARALIDEVDIEPAASQSPFGVDEATTMAEMPAATIALVRWDDEAGILEYYSLGDSAVLIHTSSGAVEYYEQGGPEAFDAALRQRVAEYAAANPDTSAADIRAEIRPHARELRRHREVPGGFWCLGLNPISASRGIGGEYDLAAVASVTLFTDGFTQVVDVFGLYDNWADVITALEHDGPRAILAELRTAQRTYDLGERPRIKPMDDVAIVHMDFPGR